MDDYKMEDKCIDNNLCKQYNCDQVQTYRIVSVRRTKEFGGFSWITIPNDGYKCYNTWFSGCHAEKWVNEK